MQEISRKFLNVTAWIAVNEEIEASDGKTEFALELIGFYWVFEISSGARRAVSQMNVIGSNS